MFESKINHLTKALADKDGTFDTLVKRHGKMFKARTKEERKFGS